VDDVRIDPTAATVVPEPGTITRAVGAIPVAVALW
jgi:hypothetical protein